MRILRFSLVSALALFLLCETAARYFGVVDFPLYETDPTIKYIVKADQKGAFLNRNDWYFNNMNMPIDEAYDAARRPDILLVGNSIIMGGNSFRQADKLTPLLQRMIGDGATVWPAAIGGWTQINEMAYLDRHADIARNADYIAWEYMAGGLSAATPWNGEYAFPTQRPLCAACYAFRRYVLAKLLRFGAGGELPVTGAPLPENVENFERHLAALALSQGAARPGLIWLYPTRAQLAEARAGRDWLPERALIAALAEKYRFKIVDIAAHPEWRAELYADGVHPGVAGNKVLAQILYGEISGLRY